MLRSFWKDFLTAIRDKKKNNPIYYSTLCDVEPAEISEKNIVLACKSTGAKKYLDKKKADIEDLIALHMKQRLTVVFVLSDGGKKIPTPLLTFEPTQEDICRKAGLMTNHTFDNFAVSSTNQVAFAASQSVSKTPGSSYNPLFLYGGVGVGKTHLAQAIGYEILRNDPRGRVLFCSSESFMNELIESIREKTTPRFRKKFRLLKLLVIDDIQFIAGKQTVQEEFFHTFNSIVSAGGQVVLTSDRPPQEIRNLEDRLRSRFSGGLIVDIQQPDFELRTAILLIKAKEKNIFIDIEAAKIIAESIVDTRSLEGTLLSLFARSMSGGQEINLDIVESFFDEKTNSKKLRITPQDIIHAVCQYYEIGPSQIKSPTRKSSTALARQIVMYLLRTELKLNLEEVAVLLKRKDHTTVIHAVNKIATKSMKDGKFREEIDTITKSLLSSTRYPRPINT